MLQIPLQEHIRGILDHILSERADDVVDGKNLYTTNNSDAIPFFVNKYDRTVIFGDNGSSHYDTRIDVDAEIEDTELVLGRYWVDRNVMGFWFILPNTEIVDTVTDALYKHLNIKVDKSKLRIVVDEENPHREGYALVDHHLVTYEDLRNKDLSIKYVEPEHYKQAYALHLADTQTKKEKLGGYITNRNKSFGKKMMMSNGKEMTKAEWDSLHRTSETRLRESELKSIIRQSLRELI